MAAFRYRNGKWQARVIRVGHAPVGKTFSTRAEAERWARQIEARIDQGAFLDHRSVQATTLRALIARYMAEVTPQMKSAQADTVRLRALQKHPVCQLNMIDLTPARIAAFRDQRLQQVTSGTVIRELAYLSSIINHARREWGITVENPVKLVRKPPTPKGRSRVMVESERHLLLDALMPRPTRRVSPWMKPLVEIALETAMRRGELLALHWSDIDLSTRVAMLPITKNGESRLVPLSTTAIGILSALPRSSCGRVFPLKPQTVAAAFMKATRRAGISDFRFHDLRHTATTSLAKRLPNVIELAAVTGHKSIHMLKRYYHPDAADLAKKLG